MVVEVVVLEVVALGLVVFGRLGFFVVVVVVVVVVVFLVVVVYARPLLFLEQSYYARIAQYFGYASLLQAPLYAVHELLATKYSGSLLPFEHFTSPSV